LAKPSFLKNVGTFLKNVGRSRKMWIKKCWSRKVGTFCKNVDEKLL
jgi:hypothetical protein